MYLWATSVLLALVNVIPHRDKPGINTNRAEKVRACAESLVAAYPRATSPEVQRYLSERHERLLNNYHTPDGKECASCGDEAWRVAYLLLDVGESPEIISFKGHLLPGLGIRQAPLVPQLYFGEVEWGAHVVAVANGIVYDPMLGNPVPLQDYSRIAFGVDLPFKKDFNTARIENFRRSHP